MIFLATMLLVRGTECACSIKGGILTVDRNSSISYEPNVNWTSHLMEGVLNLIVQHLPDMELIINLVDFPKVLPGEVDDVDTRQAAAGHLYYYPCSYCHLSFHIPGSATQV